MNPTTVDLTERLVVIAAKGGTLVVGGVLGVGSWIIAQAELPSELVGGGILATVGLVALRMVLAAAKHERQSAATIVDRLETRIEDLEEDLDDERKRAARLLVAYDRERQLRLSLEAAGIVERRSHDGEGADLLDEVDHDALAEYLESEIPSPGDETP